MSLSERTLGCVVAALAASATPLWAQSTGPSNSPATLLDRVEVTGSVLREQPGIATSALRTSTRIEDTPQSVVVLTRSLLDEQGVQTLSEALRNVSNVRGVDPRDLANGGLMIRGFNAGIVVDGVALPGSFSTPDSLASARRIEVIKGPAGTLFGGSQSVAGGGFVGGLIAITTAAPETRPFRSIGVRLGTEGERNLIIDVNQPLSPSLGLRLVGDIASAGSETQRLTHKRMSLSPSLSWRPNADAELIIRLRHSDSSSRDYSGLPARGTVVDAGYQIPRDRILTAEGIPDTTNRLTSLNLQWAQTLNQTWSWRLTVARVRSEVDQRGAFPFPFAYNSATPGPLQFLAGARLWDRYESLVISPSVTARLTTGAVKHTVIAGVDFDRTTDKAFLRFSPGGGLLGMIDVTDPVLPSWAEPDTTGTPDQTNLYRSTAFFAQDQIDLGALKLLAGIRHTKIRVEDINPASALNNVSDNRKTTFRAGATYAFTPAVSAFAGYGQSMRIPVMAYFTNPPKPEEAEQAEVGLRLTNLGGVTATLALFDLNLKNAVMADPLNPGQSIQAGRQRSRGIDLDLRWQANRQWTWLAAFSRQNPRTVDDDPSLAGKQRFNVPKTTARLATRYEMAAGSPLPGLGLGLGMTYHGALPANPTNDFFTQAATVFDAQASYRIGPTSLSLVIQNLTDKQYYQPSRYFGGGQVLPALRRTVSAIARIDF